MRSESSGCSKIPGAKTMGNGASPGESQILQELAQGVTVIYNLEHDVVVTTTDKIELCLRDAQDDLRASLGWVAPLGLAVTLITTLFATDFQKWGFSADVWEAVYLIGAVASVVWLIIAALRAFRNRNRADIQGIVAKIKDSQLRLKEDPSESTISGLT